MDLSTNEIIKIIWTQNHYEKNPTIFSHLIDDIEHVGLWFDVEMWECPKDAIDQAIDECKLRLDIRLKDKDLDLEDINFYQTLLYSMVYFKDELIEFYKIIQVQINYSNNNKIGELTKRW